MQACMCEYICVCVCVYTLMGVGATGGQKVALVSLQLELQAQPPKMGVENQTLVLRRSTEQV